MKEYYQEKIKNMIALRTNLFTTVIILTGGVLGLFFIEIPLSKLVLFLIIGVYFDFIFLSNLISIDRNITRIVEELR